MPVDPFKPVVISLPQLTPSLVVEVLPQGLTFHRIYAQADGKTHDVMIGPEDPAQYARPFHKYKNTIIGRYTNRVPVGTFTLTHPEDSSVTSSLASVSNESPSVSLHGGLKGFDAVVFDKLEKIEQLSLFSPAERDTIANSIPAYGLFKYISPDGDQGYPGEMTVEVLIGLTAPSATQVSGPGEEYDLGNLFVVYRAKVVGKDGKKVVCPINLTQHWGFNLDASLRDGEPTIRNHLIDIAADHIIELKSDFLATGKLLPTKDTPHEHNFQAGTIGARYPDNGFDHYYLFSDPPNPSALAPTRVPLTSLHDDKFDLISSVVSNTETNPPFVVLASPKSGVKASFDTNQSGVQFWSCNPFNGSGAIKRIHGGSGEEDGTNNGYKSAAAAFLEFHEPHAAFLHPDFVSKSISKNDTLLGSDHLSHNFIKVNLRFKEPPSSLQAE